MRVYDMLVDERRHLADLLDGLTEEQLRQPTLCAGWTVHDVAAHLVSFLRFGQAKLYTGLVTNLGDLDRLNRRLTARFARRSTLDLVGQLRRDSTSRTTIPFSGYDPVLADAVLHDLDIRRPFGLARTIPTERLWVVFNHLTRQPALGFGMDGRLRGLRIEAADTGWTHGAGPLVRGSAEDLVLGLSGRLVALDDLHGDGVALLRRRLAAPPRWSVAQRYGRVLGVVVKRPPAERRSRDALGIPPGP